jgi:hypothetical protein
MLLPWLLLHADDSCWHLRLLRHVLGRELLLLLSALELQSSKLRAHLLTPSVSAAVL